MIMSFKPDSIDVFKGKGSGVGLVPTDITPKAEEIIKNNLLNMDTNELADYLQMLGHDTAATAITDRKLIGDHFSSAKTSNPVAIADKLHIPCSDAVPVANAIAVARSYRPPRTGGKEVVVASADDKPIVLKWFSDSDIQETRRMMGCGLCLITPEARKPILHYVDVNDGDQLEIFVPPIPTEDTRLKQLEMDSANRDSDFEEIAVRALVAELKRRGHKDVLVLAVSATLAVMGASYEVDGVVLTEDEIYFLEVKKSHKGASKALAQLKERAIAFRNNAKSFVFKIPDKPSANTSVIDMDEDLVNRVSAMVDSVRLVFLSEAFSETAQQLCVEAGAAYMFTAGSDFTLVNFHK